MLVSDEVRAAVVRLKAKEAKEIKERKKAEAEARRVRLREQGAEAADAPRDEVGEPGGSAEAERARKRKAVHKIRREVGVESPGKRPRSQSSPDHEAAREDLIDLTSSTPLEPRAEAQQSPLPVAPEAEPPITPIESIPCAVSLEGARVRGPQNEAGPSRIREPTPTRTEAEGEAEIFTFRSMADRGKWAERMMSQVCLPDVKESLLGQGSSSFFRDVFSALFWVVNSTATMKEVLSQAEAMLNEAREEANQSRTRAEKAETAIEDAQEAEADALTRAERAEGALEIARHKAERGFRNAQEAEGRLEKAEVEVSTLKAQLHTATLLVRGAEERVSNAEEVARRSDAQAAEQTEIARVAEEKYAEAERRAAEAERRAAEAVATFKRSVEYRREIADATAFAYDVGFQDCKAKVKRTYDLDGVESLKPDLEDQIPSTPDEDGHTSEGP